MESSSINSTKTKFTADLVSTLASLSSATDLISFQLREHAQRVAYISLEIANKIDLSQAEIDQLILSCLLHDIGVSRSSEKLRLADFDLHTDQLAAHCRRGFDLLRDTTLFQDLSKIILCHHDPVAGQTVSGYHHEEIPWISRIIHLADRVDVLIDRQECILWQKDAILAQIQEHSGRLFDPVLVKALGQAAAPERFWLDLNTDNFRKPIKAARARLKKDLTLEQLTDIAALFAHIIDERSPFTANHSMGLMKIARRLAERIGFGADDLEQIKIAALLHDLGKLAVPDEILEFPGPLSDRQMQVMKQHTYFTYHLIASIGDSVDDIKRWAAYHHERLDGSGYPFGLSASELDTGSRLMAVADVTQALTENRPYRGPLAKEQATSILKKMADANHLDGHIVQIVVDEFDQLVAP